MNRRSRPAIRAGATYRGRDGSHPLAALLPARHRRAPAATPRSGQGPLSRGPPPRAPACSRLNRTSAPLPSRRTPRLRPVEAGSRAVRRVSPPPFSAGIEDAYLRESRAAKAVLRATPERRSHAQETDARQGHPPPSGGRRAGRPQASRPQGTPRADAAARLLSRNRPAVPGGDPRAASGVPRGVAVPRRAEAPRADHPMACPSAAAPPGPVRGKLD
jgi:hypothetical protein